MRQSKECRAYPFHSNGIRSRRVLIDRDGSDNAFDVRYALDSGAKADVGGGPSRAKSGHSRTIQLRGHAGSITTELPAGRAESILVSCYSASIRSRAKDR